MVECGLLIICVSMAGAYVTRQIDSKKAFGKVAVISTRWHWDVCEGLLSGYRKMMEECDGVMSDFFEVPGAWEIPLKALRLAEMGGYDAVVALGCVVKGETRHAELVMDECARGCMEVQLKTRVPLVFEVLVVDTMEQADARSGDSERNAGQLAGMTVIELLKANG